MVILGVAEVGNAIVNEIKANGGEAMYSKDVMNRESREQNLADILGKLHRPFRSSAECSGSEI